MTKYQKVYATWAVIGLVVGLLLTPQSSADPIVRPFIAVSAALAIATLLVARLEARKR